MYSPMYVIYVIFGHLFAEGGSQTSFHDADCRYITLCESGMWYVKRAMIMYEWV